MKMPEVDPLTLNKIFPATPQQDYTDWDGWPKDIPQEEFPKKDGESVQKQMSKSIETPKTN